LIARGSWAERVEMIEKKGVVRAQFESSRARKEAGDVEKGSHPDGTRTPDGNADQGRELKVEISQENAAGISKEFLLK
jgi:hypothetical protein